MATNNFGLTDNTSSLFHQPPGFRHATGNSSRLDWGGDLDFTLRFEQGFLSIVPSALFLLIFPFRWFYLQSKPRKAEKYGILGSSKVGTIFLYALLQIILLVLWAPNNQKRNFQPTTIAANTIGILDAIALGVLSFLEHRQNIRPSSLITLYLLPSVAFDAAQCRTLWLLPRASDLITLPIMFSISVGFKTVILILEVIEKRSILLSPWNQASPESLGGAINRSVFWWLNELFVRGFQGVLDLASLWPTDSMDSEKLLARLDHFWIKTKDKNSKHALAKAMVRCLKWPIVGVSLPRLCLIGLRFSQPLLLKSVVSYVSRPDGEEKTNIGYGLIGATALVYLGNAIIKGVFNYKRVRLMTMTRGALTSIVFAKVITVSASLAEAKGSNTLTLITIDVENIGKGFQLLDDIWASPIEVGIALWLLYRELSVAFIFPMIIAGLCTLAIFKLSPLIGEAFATWNKGIQERVSLTSSILGSMKEVKLLGQTDRWGKDIQAHRVEELELSKKARILSVYRLVISRISTYLTPAITFGVFIVVSHRNGGGLSVSTAFTSLSLISLLSSPLSLMFTALPQAAVTLACFARIQEFLVEDDNSLVTASNQTHNAASTELGAVNQSAGSAELERSRDNILTLKNAFFGTKEDGSLITHGLDLKIQRSTLTMIIGRIGSGKSTLLKGLIGELPTETGCVQRSFVETAYCTQQPWLTNTSIRNTILGPLPFEARWYDTVIQACALDRDFASLPLGDLTVVGSKGISISGGQKARVALARAIYSRRDVAIIDDMLSGLDRSTEELVWNNVFGPRGIFRQYGVTVILATHTTRHLRDADNIVVLGDDGTIQEQGTLESLNLQNGYVKSLIINSKAQERSTHNPAIIADNASSEVSVTASKASEQEEDMLRKTGDVTLYKYYLKSVGWKDGISILILTIGAQFCVYLPQVWIKLWTEADAKHPGDRTGMFLGVYLMFGVLGLVFLYWAIYYSFIVITPKSGAYSHQKLVDVIMGAPLYFFKTTDTGVTINRFSQDMSLLDIGLSPGAFLTLFGFVSCVMGLILIIISLKYISAIIPFAVLFLYGLQLFYLRTSRQLRHMDLEAKSPLYTHLLETVSGISTIRAFGWTRPNMTTSLNFLDVSQKPFYLLNCIQQWLQLVLDLFTSGVAILFVGIAVSTTTSPGSVGLALLSMLTLNQSLVTAIVEWTELETSLGAVARLRSMELNTPKEAQDDQTLVPENEWPSKGEVHFDNVVASYSPNTPSVLKTITLKISAGQKIAICGRTGSGKSSLLLTLAGLIPLTSGTITVDTHPTHLIPLSLLRCRLNFLPQEPILFPGTVRSNLIHTCCSDPSMITALRTVHLWDLLLSRGGLDADVQSLALSQGQKMLVCLARAILRKGEGAGGILVCDEMCSSLDDETEGLVRHVISEEWVERTVVEVVHRLDGIKRFDVVAVMDGGRLVEFGAPDDLMGRENGFLRRLIEGRG